MRRPVAQWRHGQRGVVAVEVGLVMMLFVIMLLAITDLTRLLWTWSAATEATRLGARLASVCDLNAPVIKRRMREQLSALSDSNISIEYFRPGSTAACVADDPVNACRAVRVKITGYQYRLVQGLLPQAITMPDFRTTVPREVMQSAGNPICS
jgi:Flp pilus assembly protein TadG